MTGSPASYAGALRTRIPDIFLVNPQVALASRDGRFLSHPMGLFETVPDALAALKSEAGIQVGGEPSFEGIFTYVDPDRRFHDVDFVYRVPGEAGPAFREPTEGQRWILRACAAAGNGTILHEHPDLGERVYPEPFHRLLRPHVKTDWLLNMGAGAYVMDDDGKILLQKRRDNGQWANPGGCLEMGEKIGESAVREVEEETGYRVGNAVLTAVFSGPECVITYPNGDRLRYIDFLFEASVVGGSARPVGEETLDLGWFDPRALPNGTMEVTRSHIGKFLGSRGRFLLD